MLLKEFTLDSKNELKKYFDLVESDACEYSFTTLYMWQHLYRPKYYIGKDFAVIIQQCKDCEFTIIPLAKDENIEKAIQFALEYIENKYGRIILNSVTKNIVEFIDKQYNEKFEYIEQRDLFDYVYDAESLRTLRGKKNQKKRNHINSFIKEYGDKYEYKLLNHTNFGECMQLMKTWTNIKKDSDEYDNCMDEELIGIKNVFENYDEFKDRIKIGGVYIEDKLEAFTIGEYLNSNMALIHIEKANPNIKGLYPFINEIFLSNEFEDVDFVNREEDMGITGLKKSKLSYHPCRFVEKYNVIEK